ncbi:mCG147136 [Mus musculus]|nr:mCG147136 [Mus musculus]
MSYCVSRTQIQVTPNDISSQKQLHEFFYSYRTKESHKLRHSQNSESTR